MTASVQVIGRPATVVRSDDLTLDVIIHQSANSRRIIINMPGFRGDIDGYNNKYRVLGNYLARQGVGAYIQMPNIERLRTEYYNKLLGDLAAVIRYAIKIAPDICATDTPELCLVGFSAGGSTVAAEASQHPEVKKILLMEPSAHAVHNLRDRLTPYTGDVCIVMGGGPDAIGERTGMLYQEAFTNAARNEMVVIPRCDHQFRGTANGQVMAKAPKWAFVGDPTFPSPEGGLVLY